MNISENARLLAKHIPWNDSSLAVDIAQVLFEVLVQEPAMLYDTLVAIAKLQGHRLRDIREILNSMHGRGYVIYSSNRTCVHLSPEVQDPAHGVDIPHLR